MSKSIFITGTDTGVGKTVEVPDFLLSKYIMGNREIKIIRKAELSVDSLKKMGIMRII